MPSLPESTSDPARSTWLQGASFIAASCAGVVVTIVWIATAAPPSQNHIIEQQPVAISTTEQTPATATPWSHRWWRPLTDPPPRPPPPEPPPPIQLISLLQRGNSWHALADGGNGLVEVSIGAELAGWRILNIHRDAIEIGKGSLRRSLIIGGPTGGVIDGSQVIAPSTIQPPSEPMDPSATPEAPAEPAEPANDAQDSGS